MNLVSKTAAASLLPATGVLRAVIAICSLAGAAALAPAASAGSYVLTSQTGGTVATSSGPPARAYIPNAYENYYGNGAGWNNGDVTCSGTITTTFTWTPSYQGDTSQPPQWVFVYQTCNTTVGAEYFQSSPSWDCNNGLGAEPQVTSSTGPNYISVIANNSTYTLVPGTPTITVVCSPFALSPNAPVSNAHVYYFASIANDICFYHGTLLSVANSLINAQLVPIGSADFGQAFYTLDQSGYTYGLGSLLGIRAVRFNLNNGGTENTWGVVQFEIPAVAFGNFWAANEASIVTYDNSNGMDDPAPSNAPQFTSTDPADQPNASLNPIPVGPMNWYDFAWNNWWLFRNDPLDEYIFGSDDTDYSPLWVPNTFDDLPNYGLPLIRGRFFQPRKGNPYPLGLEWPAAGGNWQWVWNTTGLDLLNEYSGPQWRTIVQQGTYNP